MRAPCFGLVGTAGEPRGEQQSSCRAHTALGVNSDDTGSPRPHMLTGLVLTFAVPGPGSSSPSSSLNGTERLIRHQKTSGGQVAETHPRHLGYALKLPEALVSSGTFPSVVTTGGSSKRRPELLSEGAFLHHDDPGRHPQVLLGRQRHPSGQRLLADGNRLFSPHPGGLGSLLVFGFYLSVTPPAF